MEQERLIAGLVVLVIGAIQAIFAGPMLRFQTWTQRVVMGAKYEPGPRTAKIVRGMGLVFVVLGLMIIAGVIR